MYWISNPDEPFTLYVPHSVSSGCGAHLEENVAAGAIRLTQEDVAEFGCDAQPMIKNMPVGQLVEEREDRSLRLGELHGRCAEYEPSSGRSLKRKEKTEKVKDATGTALPEKGE